MSFRYTSPRRFHPGHSLLGRWIRTRVPDERRAVGAYFFASGLILFGLIFAQQLAWALWLVVGDGAAGWRLPLFYGQLVSAGLYLVVCVWGFRPGFTVRLEGTELFIESTGAVLRVQARPTEAIPMVPERTFYRHHRVYARTRSFVVPGATEVWVVEDRGAVIGVGLPAEPMAALRVAVASEAIHPEHAEESIPVA